MSYTVTANKSAPTEDTPVPSGKSVRLSNIALVGAMVLFGLGIRLVSFDFLSGDYIGPLRRWYAFIIENGVFNAWGREFSDYAPTYLYFLSFSTLLGLKPVYAIKLISLVFEALLAVFAFRLVRVIYPKGMAAYWAAWGVVFFPTVVFNGSVWGQCDVIHTSMVVLSLYFVMRDKPLAACLAYGFALSIKLQAIFVLPLFCLLVLLRRIPFTYFLATHWIYLALAVPCLIAGRSLESVLSIYFKQADQYPILTLNAPNIYQWLPNSDWLFSVFNISGIISAAVVSGVLMFCFVLLRKRQRTLRPVEIIHLALLFAVLEPFLLPRMHERYFFLADVLAVLYAFARPNRWFVPILIGGASIAAYIPFLFQIEPIKLSYAAVAMAVALEVLLWDFIQGLKATKSDREMNSSEAVQVEQLGLGHGKAGYTDARTLS